MNKLGVNELENNQLYHYGIKGQKWGVRRFQTKNGRLTPAGRKRAKDKNWSDDAKEAARIKKKKVSEMSNAELRKYNERVQLEQNYSRLNPSVVNKGMKCVAGAAVTTTTVLTLYNNSGKLINIGKKIVGRR